MQSKLAELLHQYFELGVAEGREGRNHDTETGDAQRVLSEIEAEIAALSTDAEPVFWYRPLNDGLYEGPVYASSIGGKMLRDEKPGEWHPLYAAPPAPAVAVKDAIAEAEALADRAGIDIGDDRDMFVDDLAKTLTRFAALSAQVQDVAEYEHREQVCKDAALSQWERSLKRPDLDEKDRVTGAIEAYKRQAFAFTMLSAEPAAKQGEAE